MSKWNVVEKKNTKYSTSSTGGAINRSVLSVMCVKQEGESASGEGGKAALGGILV